MPWSQELRTRCTSGSLMASMMVLSSSVSAPSISRRICLFSATAMSRTTRGSLFQTMPIGCMRVFMTPSCSSLVIRFSRCEVALSAASSRSVLYCRIWLRVSTNSPTRSMSLSSRPTATRMLASATAEDLAVSSPGTGSPVGCACGAVVAGDGVSRAVTRKDGAAASFPLGGGAQAQGVRKASKRSGPSSPLSSRRRAPFGSRVHRLE